MLAAVRRKEKKKRETTRKKMEDKSKKKEGGLKYKTKTAKKFEYPYLLLPTYYYSTVPLQQFCLSSHILQ